MNYLTIKQFVKTHKLFTEKALRQILFKNKEFQDRCVRRLGWRIYLCEEDVLDFINEHKFKEARREPRSTENEVRGVQESVKLSSLPMTSIKATTDALKEFPEGMTPGKSLSNTSLKLSCSPEGFEFRLNEAENKANELFLAGHAAGEDYSALKEILRQIFSYLRALRRHITKLENKCLK